MLTFDEVITHIHKDKFMLTFGEVITHIHKDISLC